MPTSRPSNSARNTATTASAIRRTSPSATWCNICRSLEAQGLTKQQIIDNYVFFTAGSCGPCRFGMYEAEYRLALQNAGFEGFRVLLFQQNDGVKAASGEAGLKFTVDFGLGMFNALNLGDIMHEMIYRVRPFEVEKGQTDRVFHEAVDTLCTMLARAQAVRGPRGPAGMDGQEDPRQQGSEVGSVGQLAAEGARAACTAIHTRKLCRRCTIKLGGRSKSTACG